MASKSNKASILFRRTTAIISVLALTASAMLIITSCGNNKESSSEVETTYTSKIETTVTTEEPEPILTLLPGIQERIDRNPDSAGWIKIDGVVDEEIVHRTDEETGNTYYLDHNINGETSEGGTIFADYRNILDGRKISDNIILYGHNQRDNTRFGNIDLYKWNLSYYKNHSLINYSTNYEERQYKIFALFVTNVEPEHDDGVVFDYHNYIDLKDEARYNDFVSNVMKRSLILTGVDLEYGDKFLTLSTCSTEFEPSRLVMVAREVRDGESTEIDMANFKVNPNPMWPAIYYKYHGGSYVESN